MSAGIILVTATVLVTAVLCALRLREVLFLRNVDGRMLFDGLVPHLAARRTDAVLAACDSLPGISVAEVVRAAVTAAPEGREAIERAVDEAELDWLPEREQAKGMLSTLARVSAAAGMMGGVLEIRAALAHEHAVLPLGPIVVTLGGGILGVVISLYARALVSRTIERIREETERAARRLPDLLAPTEKSLELSSARNDGM